MKHPFPPYKTISVAALVPYARNSRTHSQQQVDKIAASIREFGFLNPIIVDGDNGIIAGHGRVMAAQKLGLDSLPVIEASHLTEAQRRAYVIADNRLALDAGWDNELLKVELQDLDAQGFDLTLTGFELDEIEAFKMEEENLPGEGANEGSTASLADKFGIAPFSVLNAREGWWQSRKRAWLALGIKSELGRGENGHHAAPGGVSNGCGIQQGRKAID
jgi:ParB-like chromosome segregation protein Spo0J